MHRKCAAVTRDLGYRYGRGTRVRVGLDKSCFPDWAVNPKPPKGVNVAHAAEAALDVILVFPPLSCSTRNEIEPSPGRGDTERCLVRPESSAGE